MKIPHLNHMKAWCDDGKVSVNWYSQSNVKYLGSENVGWELIG